MLIIKKKTKNFDAHLLDKFKRKKLKCKMRI